GDNDYRAAFSNVFDVSQIGGLGKVQMTAQPAGAAPGIPFEYQPVVQVLDAKGNVMTDFNGPVSVVLDPTKGTPGATLSGTKTVQAVNGVATFTDLSIDKAGKGYQLFIGVDNAHGVTDLNFNVAAVHLDVLQIGGLGKVL